MDQDKKKMEKEEDDVEYDSESSSDDITEYFDNTQTDKANQFDEFAEYELTNNVLFFSPHFLFGRKIVMTIVFGAGPECYSFFFLTENNYKKQIQKFFRSGAKY